MPRLVPGQISRQYETGNPGRQTKPRSVRPAGRKRALFKDDHMSAKPIPDLIKLYDPPIKIHDPNGSKRPPEKPTAIEIIGNGVGAIIALAAAIASLGVLVLACQFLRWTLLD